MSAKEHGFKAEVQQLLDLMVHSLYSDREIFLRELISNAADALDRARFLSLTRDDLVEPEPGLPGIRVSVDAEAKTITVEDDGVGLTADEAIDNLGTIAKSGTKAFMKALEKGKDAPDLIGQFGVGFYASFMVADRVTVVSRSALPGEDAVRWQSDGQGTFTVEPAEREHRGTTITLTLRDDASDFLDASRLSHVVRRYSNFLQWPIHVDGEQANQAKALWQEPPSQVDEDERAAFYKALSMDWEDPALSIHLRVDSPLQYSALLFVPSRQPFDLFQPEADRGPRLYAKRVLILEHAKDLLPEWLRFVRGVVDSEDIQLNVSRELVQKTPVVRKIRDALTKRVLKELQKLAKSKAPEDGEHPYDAVWRNFGVVLKEGYYHEGEGLRERLQPLLRFTTLSEDDGLVSLSRYTEAMPEGQDAIWFITAPSRDAALASPHLEAFEKRGWDVLVLTDPVDEWLVTALTEVDGVPLKSVTRGELELDDEDDDQADKMDLGELAPWLEGLYAGEVAGVRASSRLTDSACVLVDDEAGVSANMERILRAANQQIPAARRFLELNPRHPLIKNLARLHEAGRSDDVEPLARLLLDDALLLEGSVKDPATVGRRLQELLERAAAQAVGSA